MTIKIAQEPELSHSQLDAKQPLSPFRVSATLESTSPAEKIKKKRKAAPGGRAKLLNIPRGWAHQAFFYQDPAQRIGWLALELIVMFVSALLISKISLIPLFNIRLWAAALPIAHTANWVFNGNWWAGMLFTFPRLRNPGEKATCDYLNSMASRLRPWHAISGVMIFGSVSRGQWHDRSDLDMRLLRREGLLNGIIAVGILFREKFIALSVRQPLDIYLADGVDFLSKLRSDEPPVFLKKDDSRLDELYPNRGEVKMESFALTSKRGLPEGD